MSPINPPSNDEMHHINSQSDEDIDNTDSISDAVGPSQSDGDIDETDSMSDVVEPSQSGEDLSIISCPRSLMKIERTKKLKQYDLEDTFILEHCIPNEKITTCVIDIHKVYVKWMDFYYPHKEQVNASYLGRRLKALKYESKRCSKSTKYYIIMKNIL